MGTGGPHHPVRRLWVALLAVGLASCSGGTPSGPPPVPKQYLPRVALFGDSLSAEAQPYFSSLVQATHETALTYDSFGGTAICDWLPRMAEVEKRYHPRAVELQFSGNAFTPCMAGHTAGVEYLAKYRADTLAAIGIFAPGGGHVFLIGAPIARYQQGTDWQALNRQYADIAAADPRNVTYVDAGTAVEGPGQTFVTTLPCLLVEPCLGPSVNGVPSNTVRSPDGTHFCPVAQANRSGVVGGCPVYSSGAYRYAAAMVQALQTPVGP